MLKEKERETQEPQSGIKTQSGKSDRARQHNDAACNVVVNSTDGHRQTGGAPDTIVNDIAL